MGIGLQEIVVDVWVVRGGEEPQPIDQVRFPDTTNSQQLPAMLAILLPLIQRWIDDQQ